MRHPIRIAAAAAVLLMLAGCSSTPATVPLSNYVLGEKVNLGRLSYTVFETQWMTHLGEGAGARVPQHRFFLIRMSVTNGSSSDVTLPNPTILDDGGKVYEEVSTGEGVPQWAGYLRVARPADTVQGNIVFDAPPGHYKLKLADESGKPGALIDIPLTFGAETPEVVSPGEKK